MAAGPRSDPRPRLTLSAALCAAGALLTLLGATFTYPGMRLPTVLVGLGLAASVPNLLFARGNWEAFFTRLEAAIVVDSPVWARRLSALGAFLFFLSFLLAILAQPTVGPADPFGTLQGLASKAPILLMTVGVLASASGLVLFRRRGTDNPLAIPLWRADDFLTSPGVWLAIGGWLAFVTGAIWNLVQLLS